MRSRPSAMSSRHHVVHKNPLSAADPDPLPDVVASWPKWWLLPDPLSTKWLSLQHAGPCFPPDYTPHGVPILYGGQPVSLGPAAEEAATLYAATIGVAPSSNVFDANFFSDFLTIIRASEPTTCPITEFDKCDFSPLINYLSAERARRQAMSADEKAAAKAAKAALEEPHAHAYVDGQPVKLGAFHVDPPCIFRGRGQHPLAGKIRARVRPEDVIINVGESDPVPLPPSAHKWKQVVHDHSALWVAKWTDSIEGGDRYVHMPLVSAWKGLADFKKFEAARRLKGGIERVRREYMRSIRDEASEQRERQLATAVYLIDWIGLRVGGSPSQDADDGTVGILGCCSLQCKDIAVTSEDTVSIAGARELALDPLVCTILRSLKQEKQDAEPLFHLIDFTLLSRYLTSLMDGLTATVFRAFNASFSTQQELARSPANAASIDDLVSFHGRALEAAAARCHFALDALSTEVTGVCTAQVNYVDPRISVSWCKRHHVPIERVFMLSLTEKYVWALDVDPDWHW
ncbi:hypothetical protein BCR44DRAFT_1431871 [Catenaria anguillulae PL171]|uniref:DNA topoisomerase 1 n=1 Tax=Catenaria anguillulae PL171 TaxID=765915 RepID=A0A1Y2HSC9_9FUNG|nr:hypothetical protein BCR44DRAFT_1431871 [Catenaria anguillulae PL171]